MILLVDTRVFLWWDRNHSALPGQPRALIADGANRALISVGSIWEIVIKRWLGS